MKNKEVNLPKLGGVKGAQVVDNEKENWDLQFENEPEEDPYAQEYSWEGLQSNGGQNMGDWV